MQAVDYYEEQSPGVGDRFNRAVDEALRLIARFPKAGQVQRQFGFKSPVLRGRGIKGFPYKVVYFVERGEPVIVALVHYKRDVFWIGRVGSE